MARQGSGNEDGHLQSPDFLCRVAHNTGAMMRRLDDGKGAKDGKPGNMYQHLGGTEEERQKNLALFKAWVGNWSLKQFSENFKEELNGIKVRY